jgi:hypothetical protein
MVPALIFVCLVAVVAVLSYRAQRAGVRLRGCCSNRPWPPADLTGSPAKPDRGH